MKSKSLFLSLVVLSIIFSCSNEEIDTNNTELTATKSFNAHGSNTVYLSSNLAGKLYAFNLASGLTTPSRIEVSVPYADADGLVYDAKREALYQVNRSGNSLVAYSNILGISNGEAIMPSAMSDESIMSGREATFYNNKVVVADDVTPGVLRSYHVNEDQINDYRTFMVDFELWGIQSTGKDLWAIVDVTNQVAMFQNFHNAKSGNLMPDFKVGIEGLIRTHGLNYDDTTDTMVLTDIGSAASNTDGGLIIIHNFMTKMMMAGNGGTIPVDQQIRIYGPSTKLGNPVDVVYSTSKNAIMVAERANNLFLIFEMPEANCDCAPVLSEEVSGASAITTNFY